MVASGLLTLFYRYSYWTAMSGRSLLLKVILLGDGGVGKSSLMNRYVTNKFDSQAFHTIGVEFLNQDLEVDGRLVTLQIWDTAGQERFKSLRTPFYRGADCCLLTFSIDDRHSFENLTGWKKEFILYADIKEPARFPFVVLGNKSDKSERAQAFELEGVSIRFRLLETLFRDFCQPPSGPIQSSFGSLRVLRSLVHAWVGSQSQQLDCQCPVVVSLWTSHRMLLLVFFVQCTDSWLGIWTFSFAHCLYSLFGYYAVPTPCYHRLCFQVSPIYH
uniref:small monomeric GTPase n=2 Tax=Leptobrachium leishanense TaxID=445787 RepID=A0A8C5PV20_9ANUR